MTVQSIVEGHGDVTALPTLLRRLAAECHLSEVRFAPPLRLARAEFRTAGRLPNLVLAARSRPDCDGLLVLFDSDDACPKETAPALQASLQAMLGGVPCQVVMAHREFESWFLAGLAGLRGHRGIRPDAVYEGDPEQPRDAKGRLQAHLLAGRTYTETDDQPALAARFDLTDAYRRSRSFRRLVAALGRLAIANGLSLTMPSTWTTSP